MNWASPVRIANGSGFAASKGIPSRTTCCSSLSVAAEINRSVQDDACDGFILVPHLIPAGLDEFAATVVPLLQERGVFRSSYEEGTTLRDRLGLGPARSAGSWAAARREHADA